MNGLMKIIEGYRVFDIFYGKTVLSGKFMELSELFVIIVGFSLIDGFKKQRLNFGHFFL